MDSIENLNGVNPKISVILPVFNGEKYIKEAVNSILRQTYSNFELIILDDVSTDSTPQIIDLYTDKRIRHVYFKERMGLVKSMNYGIVISNGEYIARMDADDVSFKDRFAKQIDYMEKHIDIGVIGGQTIYIDDNKIIGHVKYPITDNEIKETMLFRNPFAHPAVMIRKEVLINNNIYYNDKFSSCEDVELWSRLMKVTRFHNLNSFVLKYHISEGSLTMKAVKNYDSTINYINVIYSQVFSYFQITDIQLTQTDAALLFNKCVDKYSNNQKKEFIKKYEGVGQYTKDKIRFYKELGFLWIILAKRRFLLFNSYKILIYGLLRYFEVGSVYVIYKAIGIFHLKKYS